MKKGIDVSYWQKGLKLASVSPEFVVVRAGFGDAGIKKDPCYNGFVKQADALGVPYGAYFYGDAHDMETLKKELDAFRKYVGEASPTLGLWYDLEGKMLSNSNALNREIILELKNNNIGLYASASFMRSIVAQYPDIFFGARLWVACWGAKNCPSVSGNVIMWQYNVDREKNIDLDYLLEGETVGETTPTLRKGDVGEAVQTLQQALNDYFAGAYVLKLDGIFGEKTRRGVIACQSLGGLIIDGVVGVKTWEYLTSGIKL